MITRSNRNMVRGMGAACPSIEQLQGISDVNDPCQAVAGITATGDTIVPAAITSPTSAVIQAIGSGTDLIPTQAASLLQGAVSFFQANPIFAVAGGVLLILLFSGGNRGRR